MYSENTTNPPQYSHVAQKHEHELAAFFVAVAWNLQHPAALYPSYSFLRYSGVSVAGCPQGES